MSQCTFALSSVTYAYKGREALDNRRIKSHVVKLGVGETSRGCRYGLAVDCRDKTAAMAALLSSGVVYSEIIQ